MAGPGTFFGAPLMAGTTPNPTTNPSTGAVTPSDAGTAELTQLVSVGFGSLTASLAVPPGSIITNLVAIITTTITGATSWTVAVATATPTTVASTASSSTLTAGTNVVGTIAAAGVNPATIGNPGTLTVTLTAASISAGKVSVMVQYMPTVENLDSNF